MSSEAPRALGHVWLGAVPHGDAWALQQRVAHARASGELDGDCLLLLDHPPVDLDQGRTVTFHGPGQLVAHPIVRLADVIPSRFQGEPCQLGAPATQLELEP